ncbi:MAG: glycoside hydrolase family 127 protein [Bacteroides sp.]|nr:glycoside hydrolase family 127 protein [Eubacterium sp.]MCM1418418.1 glycoside hydrolase family 127 protein [Roseburia sp.]MCM1461560.1 glycoside hydrolase family 127 protein [Bacteroides sp.]
MKKLQKPIDIHAYRPAEGFIRRYQALVKDEVIPYQYRVLRDEADGAEKSHVFANFRNAASVLAGGDKGDGFYGMVFQDSDAAKWIEAAAYSLAVFPDAALEARVDELIELIASAQDEDGYLNTRFTIDDREKRWTNLLEGHELYCAGHLMEAAVAYHEVTGKARLLNVMLKNAEHIYRRFITEKRGGYPGHPEVELALLRLYRASGDRRCLELAAHFLNARGADRDFYKKEAAARDWTVWGNNPEDLIYQQSFAPIREQKDAVGHAVRAVYLYTGMADLAAETEDAALLAACHRLWESITRKRMYVTGGIGSTGIGEAFTVDYDLPNDTAYAESCASVGLMMFASRLLESEARGEYADVMETAFYNTVLAGMSLDGRRFFYVNPLEVIPGISGVAATHWHDRPARSAWYACACCPPNIARAISSIGKYAYGESETTAYCHLYAAGEVAFANGLELMCETGYPYDFLIRYRVRVGGKALAIRVPGWSETFSLAVNGERLETTPTNGYLILGRIESGDVIELKLDDRASFVYPSPRIAENTGAVAVRRGPLVYCFEGADNGGDVLSLRADDGAPIEVGAYRPDLLGGTVPLTLKGVREKSFDGLYSMAKPEETPVTLTAVPYYTWGNRGEGEMRVWVTRK